MKTWLCILASSLVGILAGACSADQPSGGRAGDMPKNTEPTPSEHVACAADADCVVVETACCDHCNGGSVEAFNTTHAAVHKATGCEQTRCTERGCGEAVAKCKAGTCAVEVLPIAGFDGPPPT